MENSLPPIALGIQLTLVEQSDQREDTFDITLTSKGRKNMELIKKTLNSKDDQAAIMDALSAAATVLGLMDNGYRLVAKSRWGRNKELSMNKHETA